MWAISLKDEFIENPLVSWETLFGSGDDDEMAEKDAKDGKAAETPSGDGGESSAPSAVPATTQPGE